MPYKTLKTFIGHEKNALSRLNVLKLTLIIFFLVIAIFFIPLYFLLEHDYKQVNRLNDLRIENKLHNAEAILKRDFFGIVSNIAVVADAPVIKNYFKNYHYRIEIESLFKRIASTYQRYDQIRLLDLEGNELIRVDYENNKPVVKQLSALQNKRDREYFVEALKLDKSEVYVSDLSLNIDHGVLEFPYQPVIRVATGIYDGVGNKVGVLVFNYNAQILLDNISLLFHDSIIKAQLINKNGYYLYSDDQEKLFGADLGNSNLNINLLNNEIWQKRHTGSQTFELNNNLNIIYKVYPLNPDSYASNTNMQTIPFRISDMQTKPLGISKQLSNDYYWYLLLQVSKSELEKNYFHKSILGKILMSLLVFLSALISLLISLIINISNAKVKQKESSIEKIKKLSETDELTNLSNRRHFFEVAKKGLSIAKSHHQCICLMMIDIDYFKKINDTYGHSNGDQVLIHFASIVSTELRENDIFARLGGEEFAIVHFP